jgi:hypothetical protein
MDKMSTMESWMTKFDSNLSAIIMLLLRLEPLFPNLQILHEQKLLGETFACEDGVGELHVMEGLW